MASLVSRRLASVAVRTSSYRTFAAAALQSRAYSQDRQAGSIRDAGGSFGKKEKAQEDQYFRKLQEEQLQKLHDIKKFHEEELKHHQDAIDRHDQKIQEFKEKIQDNVPLMSNNNQIDNNASAQYVYNSYGDK
ncbi:uncharacterized protein TRIADDRAFT_61171 [Trichoplax adhaerens]|uniref:ATPase inhibitor, mitochondrial n=1 Tax=Trichoplax adhaerens TaxID=10228 RepID=B3SA83_TRIAD|nr:hypothetical protein TRIADDRAFT_61171 [Trichoplax adhaerens]EDV20470.1 hypothetical protein TRIADDRAFT_61171 [Trichoplax adhaerens]|eukprot:XP_002117164.1 hypothetical protein TRIADDRAFT_61171 [Trichoplax adhaerens]